MPHSYVNTTKLFLKYADISNVEICLEIENIFSRTDFKNYISIAKCSNEVKDILKKIEGTSIGNSKILNYIAKAMGYKNNHHLKQSLPAIEEIPNYFYTTLSDQYQLKTIDPYSIKQFHDILNNSGLEGILPCNLPDDLLADCSKQVEILRNDEDGSISLLLCAVLCLYSGKNYLTEESMQVTIPIEELHDNLSSYSVMVLLEEMRRLKIIKIQNRDLPKVSNFFDKKRKIKIEILNSDLYSQYLESI